MPRNMSFALTKQQMRDQTKTVTRRNGWKFLKTGHIVQPVEKCMGLPKGSKQIKIGDPIQILKVSWEPLNHITQEECVLEGFPDLTPAEFIEMYRKANRCSADHLITRIEFEFLNKASNDTNCGHHGTGMNLYYEKTTKVFYDFGSGKKTYLEEYTRDFYKRVSAPNNEDVPSNYFYKEIKKKIVRQDFHIDMVKSFIGRLKKVSKEFFDDKVAEWKDLECDKVVYDGCAEVDSIEGAGRAAEIDHGCY